MIQILYAESVQGVGAVQLAKRLQITLSAAAKELQQNVMVVHRLKSPRGLREWAPKNTRGLGCREAV